MLKVHGLSVFMLPAILGCMCLSLPGYAAWTDQALLDYLLQNNNQDAICIRSLRIEQKGSELKIYNATGREEERQQVHQRLILSPAQPAGPFSHGNEFVIRVNRLHDISVMLQADHIQAGGSKRLIQQPITALYAQFKPNSGKQLIKAQNGRFILTIPKAFYCSELLLEYPAQEIQHSLKLKFINVKMPVTLEE